MNSDGFDSGQAEDIRKARETEQELRRIREEEPEFYRDMMELDSMTPDLPRGEVDWDTLEKIEDDPIEWQRYDARREELEEKYGDTKVWDMNDLLYRQEQAARNMGRSGMVLYYDTAGEIEARNASGRRSLDAASRKKTPPMLGGEDTVFGYGISEYIDTKLVIDTFQKAYEKRGRPSDLLFHSDQGTQYTCFEFRQMLRGLKVIQSFSAHGNPYDKRCSGIILCIN